MRNADRPMGRFFCLLMVMAAPFLVAPAGMLAAPPTGSPSTTQVTDTVYRADGQVAKGTVLISWSAFTTADGYAIAAGSLSVQLGNGGAFSASLAPNTGAQPAGVYYKVVYQLTGQEPSTEYWVVPATGSTSIGAVRAKLMPPTIAAQVLTRDVADTNYVHVNGDQTMNGVVTFTTPPTVPDPQKATDVANKEYVDSAATNLLASPPSIGSSTPNAGTFTVLAGQNTNGIWNPARFSGTSAGVQIGNALAACSGTPCVVQVPPLLGTGWWTRSNPPATAGKYVLDWRQNGLNLWEDTADNTAGSAVGIGIHINNGSYPPINPATHNPVGLYVEVNSDSQKYPLWAINPLVGTTPGADTEIIASEADVNNNTVDQPNVFASTLNRKFGYTAISAGTVPSTAGLYIGSAYLGAAWHHGITMQHVIDNVMDFFNVSVQITQAITGSPNVQTVSARSNLSWPEVGTWVTIDSGANQEDVQITGVSATSISGIFRKSHVSGLYAATYTGGGGINFTKTIFRQSPLILGDLQYTSATGSPHFPSVGLVNGTGALTTPLYWDTAGTQHSRSVASSGTGFAWEDTSGTQLESLAVDTGVHSGTTFLWNKGARVSGSDMNSITACGYYDGNNMSNAPSYFGTNYLHFEVICSDDPNYLTQVAYEMTTGTYRSWIRQRVAGAWAGWLEAPNTTNVNATNGTFTNLTVTGTCAGCGSGGSGDLSSPGPIGSVAPNTGSFTTLNAADLRAKNWPVVDLRANGLVGDLVTLSTCSMTASSAVLTCGGANFAAGDIGKKISIAGAGTVGGANYVLNATIAGYTSASTVTIDTAASHTVSGQQAWYGTDNYAAMCAITNCSSATVTNLYAKAANSGQRLLLPYGAYYTTHPFYVRTGQYLQGAGGTASLIFLFDSAGNAPAVCVNGNASAGAGTCTTEGATLEVGVSDLFVGTPTSGTQPGVEVAGASGWFVDRIWTQSAIGVLVNASNIGSIRDMTCDAGTGQCIELLGAGQTGGSDYQSATHSVTISGLKAFAPRYSCIWVDGADGVEISDAQCDYAKQYGLYIYSPEGYTSSRLHVQNSHFTSSLTSGYYTQNQNCFYIGGAAADVLLEGSTCAHWQSNDVLISDSAVANNVVIKGNMFKDSGAGAGAGGYSAASINVGSHTTGLTLEGNTFDHPGAQAVVSASASYVANNRCFSPFNTTAAPGPDYNNGCFNFSGASAAGSIAVNNTTDSTLYPAVSYSGGANSTTSTNRSGYAYDVAMNSSSAGCCSSWNERVENAGSIGLAALSHPAVPGNGYLVSKYPSIQAAIDAAYNNGSVLDGGTVIDDRTSPYTGPGFIVRDSVTVKLAATTYTITGTVSNNNGVATVTAGILSMPGSHIVGAGTSPNHGTNVNAGNGLNADLIATSTVGTGSGANAQWWHWGSIENFHIDGNKANQTAGNCINVENMGETAVLRALELGNCYASDIKLEGNFATQSEISNVTVNSAGQFGVNLDNFQGVGVLRGLSGDSNATSIIRFNGSQSATLTVLGLKSEEEISGHDPLITIDMPGDGSQPAFSLVGGYTYARPGVQDVIKVINGKSGSAPFVTVSNFYVDANFVNAVNDTVNSRTFAAANMNKVPFSYLPTGSYQSGQAFTFAPGTFIQGGSSALTEIFGSSTDGSSMIASQGNGDGTSYYTGGLKIGIPNRTQFGLPPEMMARMGSRFLGAGLGYDANTWVFVPIWKTGDASNRWIGDPNQRWPEVYASDVNTTTATVGTLNVTSCVGCGSQHSLTLQGPKSAVSGAGSMTALYSVTIPAGTFSVGTGLRCTARSRHTTGSGSVSMGWRLGSTTYTYPTAYTTGTTGGDASIEIFTFSSLTAETVNIPWASFGGTTEASYTGLAWSENLSGAATLQFMFNAASSEKLTGDSFYCMTIQ